MAGELDQMSVRFTWCIPFMAAAGRFEGGVSACRERQKEAGRGEDGYVGKEVSIVFTYRRRASRLSYASCLLSAHRFLPTVYIRYNFYFEAPSRTVVDTIIIQHFPSSTVQKNAPHSFRPLGTRPKTMPFLNVLTSALLLTLTSPTWALPYPNPTSILAAQSDDNTNTAAAPPRLVAYIQTFKDVNGGPLSLLPLLEENTGVTHVLLSAVHLNENPGDINLNDHSPDDPMYDDMWAEAKKLKEGGIKVMMMLGGAAPGTYQRLSGDDETFFEYYNPLLAMLKKYNIDGLDIDIEESVPISMPLRLLRQLHSDMGKDFLLTMAPVGSALLPGGSGVGLHGFSQREMDDQATEASRPNGKLVSWYNAQFYNGWGDASSTDMYDEIVNEGGWAADRVVMGVLTNPGDGGSGFVQLSTLESVLKSLSSKHASFGCAVGWEYWAAGTADGMEFPWMWVKALGDVITGNTNAEETTSTPPSAPSNVTSSGDEAKESPAEESAAPSRPRKDPPTPWPSQMEKLESVGAGHWDSVKALNSTNGQLGPAGDLLGVTNLLNDILGQVEGIVGSLPLA
ncbi:hypothetical protein Q7P37_007743 [Cladosporium fusiforme]